MCRFLAGRGEAERSRGVALRRDDRLLSEPLFFGEGFGVGERDLAAGDERRAGEDEAHRELAGDGVRELAQLLLLLAALAGETLRETLRGFFFLSKPSVPLIIMTVFARVWSSR